MNEIGYSIKNLRKKNNLTQDELAEKLHVSRQAISNWENAKTQPDYDTLRKISIVFNQSIEGIINNETVENKKGKNHYAFIPLISFGVSIIHFIFAMNGIINPVGVAVSVMLASIISIIMFFSFESSIKSKDFTMIAGHKKIYETDLSQYETQLRKMSTIVSSQALLINLLYFMNYFTNIEKQMSISIIFFLVFF